MMRSFKEKIHWWLGLAGSICGIFGLMISLADQTKLIKRLLETAWGEMVPVSVGRFSFSISLVQGVFFCGAGVLAIAAFGAAWRKY